MMLGVAAVVVLATDTRLLTLLDGHDGGTRISIVITVLWISTICNAINFMDNMDGLAASTAATAAATALVPAISVFAITATAFASTTRRAGP